MFENRFQIQRTVRARKRRDFIAARFALHDLRQTECGKIERRAGFSRAHRFVENSRMVERCFRRRFGFGHFAFSVRLHQRSRFVLRLDLRENLLNLSSRPAILCGRKNFFSNISVSSGFAPSSAVRSAECSRCNSRRIIPELAEKCVAIGASPLSALGLALNHLQRAAIKHENGVGLARQIAMLSYKSKELFDANFARRPNRNGENPAAKMENRFDVAGYLDYQGEKFVQKIRRRILQRFVEGDGFVRFERRGNKKNYGASFARRHFERLAFSRIGRGKFGGKNEKSWRSRRIHRNDFAGRARRFFERHAANERDFEEDFSYKDHRGTRRF
jgi:hypothetical protein